MYLIPKNIKTRFEFWKGFGWFELFVVVIAFFVGLSIFKFLGFFNVTIFVRILPLVGFPGGLYFYLLPGPDGRSLHDILMQFRRWKRGQQRYLYKARSGR